MGHSTFTTKHLVRGLDPWSARSGAGRLEECEAVDSKDQLESAGTSPSVTTSNHDDLQRSSRCFTSVF